ncbi:malto-oligosyltrehalose synthase [Thalassoroseus pseudoceratinae]|uniref:malto-oligosyltrehalose synthase n=1 Tax=Thalassoroseus pseudoceratinae TaxID=2713176 RepID=UPI00141F501A|nr:malto-oligosyltrehalose synthase [Thalassoroseus pseudoceratinae]
MSHSERPYATYRLQFNSSFRFEDAQKLIPYFSRLGVTHAYSSPLLRARQDSTHGYDVVDPRSVNPNIGDETAFRTFVKTLQAHGMGLVLDIVPNHMAACGENPYWENVLTYGVSSPHARWFDIDWRMPHSELWGRVLVPVLGEPLQRVLAQDQLHVYWDQGRFRIRYWENTYPIDPATVPMILQFGMPELEEQFPEGHTALTEIQSVLEELNALPNRVERGQRHVELSLDDTEDLLSQLAQTIVMSPAIQAWAVQTAERFSSGEEGQKRLRALLRAQNYRLVYWRRAARILNYRRFFDINDLISIRQEDPEVFDDTHTLIARWISEGLLDGIRIDHIDGLRDPLRYLERLRDLISEQEPNGQSVPVWVEKIVAHDEVLPADWPSAGTTGYESLNQIESLFISPEGYQAIEESYRRMLGRPVKFEQVANWGKRRILKADLSAFVGRLADILHRLAQVNPESSVLREKELVEALVEFCVALPCYRTYITTDQTELSEHDRWAIETAIRGAEKRERASQESLDFLKEFLFGDTLEMTEHDRNERLHFIEKLQQLTGPATAKGIEDTALYAYVPLISRNEVGGEPNTDLRQAIPHFHEGNAYRAESAPRAILCVTTHDTKRTADVRARLDVLSEWPKIWFARINKWRELNRSRRSRVQDKTAPDPAAEYMFYQNLIGIWPVTAAEDGPVPISHPDVIEFLRERMEEYMLKAVREAKVRTSWTDGNSEFESALVEFIRGAMSGKDENSRLFLDDVQTFVQRVARPGFWNSLARTLFQFTSPGTPDLYQGDELWNFALVDPDNRREVDYELRQGLLDELVTRLESSEESRQELLREMVEHPEDGRIKMHSVRETLSARRQFPNLFLDSEYQPLSFEGKHSEHLVGFARTHGSEAVLAIAPRWTTSLTQDYLQAPLGEAVWGDTRISLPASLNGRQLDSMYTRSSLQAADDGTLRAADVFAEFPIALLVSSATAEND